MSAIAVVVTILSGTVWLMDWDRDVLIDAKDKVWNWITDLHTGLIILVLATILLLISTIWLAFRLFRIQHESDQVRRPHNIEPAGAPSSDSELADLETPFATPGSPLDLALTSRGYMSKVSAITRNIDQELGKSLQRTVSKWDSTRFLEMEKLLLLIVNESKGIISLAGKDGKIGVSLLRCIPQAKNFKFLADSGLGTATQNDRRTRFDRHESTAGHSLTIGESILIRDTQDNLDVPWSEGDNRSICCAPVFTTGTLDHVLCVTSDVAGDLTQDDKQTLELLALKATLVILAFRQIKNA